MTSWSTMRMEASRLAGFKLASMLTSTARASRKKLVIPGPDPDYTLGYSELQRIAEELSRHATDACSLEVFEFPATVFFDLRRHGKLEALLRIRISHCRGLTEPAGLPEQRALEDLEKELKSLGVARR